MALDREKAAAGVMLFGPLGAVLGESTEQEKASQESVQGVAYGSQHTAQALNRGTNGQANLATNPTSFGKASYVSDDGDMDYFSFALNAASDGKLNESLSYLDLELKYRPTNDAAWVLKGCNLSFISKGAPTEQAFYYIEDAWKKSLVYSLQNNGADSEAFSLTVEAIKVNLDGIFSNCQDYAIKALGTGRLTDDEFIAVYSRMQSILTYYSRISQALDNAYREATGFDSSPFESGIGKKCDVNAGWLNMYHGLGWNAYRDAIKARSYSEFPDSCRVVGNFIFKQKLYIEEFFTTRGAVQAYKSLAYAANDFVRGIESANFNSGPYKSSVSELESKAKALQWKLDRQAEKERQDKIEAYWVMHEQERQEILSSIREKEQEISNLKSDKSNLPEKKIIDELNEKREMLVTQINKLGLFDWKEKKLLRSEVDKIIEEINARSPQCKSLVSDLDRKIEKKLKEISSLQEKLSNPQID